MNYYNCIIVVFKHIYQLKSVGFLTVSTILNGNVGYLDYDFKIVLF